MNINFLLDDLDADVARKYPTNQLSSVFTDERTVLYFNHHGQPIVEFRVRQFINDPFFGQKVVLEEFSYINKLVQGE